MKNLSELVKYQFFKEDIRSAYSEVIKMKNGMKRKTSLNEFLDEL